MTVEEAVAYYFFRAWAQWEEAREDPHLMDWQEVAYLRCKAETSLYQSLGLAGLSMPWRYKLPL